MAAVVANGTTVSREDLQKRIVEQGEVVRSLKALSLQTDEVKVQKN